MKIKLERSHRSVPHQSPYFCPEAALVQTHAGLTLTPPQAAPRSCVLASSKQSVRGMGSGRKKETAPRKARRAPLPNLLKTRLLSSLLPNPLSSSECSPSPDFRSGAGTLLRRPDLRRPPRQPGLPAATSPGRVGSDPDAHFHTSAAALRPLLPPSSLLRVKPGESRPGPWTGSGCTERTTLPPRTPSARVPGDPGCTSGAPPRTVWTEMPTARSTISPRLL